MKACKGLFLFCFLGIAISSCFDPPVFTDVPQISVNKVSFKVVEGENTPDSLFLYLDFKDGDGDLGLEPEMTTTPFNQSFYFLADGTLVDGKGRLTKVTTIPQVIPTPNDPDAGDMIIDLVVPAGAEGKLVTNKTRTQPIYNYLPAFDPGDDMDCLNYTTGTGAWLMVAESDNLVDASYNIIDTLYRGEAKFFIIDNHFLFEENENHYNIDIEFWQFKNGSFQKFDWREEFCESNFDGRFPFITHRIGEPLEGTMRYSMVNASFLSIFSLNELKLKVRIRDRSLNVSNEVETPKFRLLNICSNCE